jgi:hypothetical protein
MKLNSKNIFARYYRWIYGDLPNDLCGFFWGLVFAIGLSVFVVPGRLFHSKDNTGAGSCLGAGVFFYIVYLASMGLGVRLYAWFSGIAEEGELYSQFLQSLDALQFLVYMPLIGAVTIALCIGVIYLTIISIIKLSDKDFDKPKLIQNTSDWVGAIRKKHCTKINWK